MKTTKKSIEFIQNPDSLSKLNLSEIRGGKADNPACTVHCTGSSCNAQNSQTKDMTVC